MTLPEIESDMTPTTKEAVAKYSYQYQREWRFEREKRLIQHALTIFPKWKYLHDRMEWHSRPTFHHDPEKSKTQPRKPLHLPRDWEHTPKQEVINSMCFVTGASSNAPYFDLSIQLLESIKATRWYNHIPIKVLDCGLTKEHLDYLRARFGCEVKDPGWDGDPATIQPQSGIPVNGFKCLMGRAYIHKHFPGYEYYFWMDADTWIQDERAIDQFIFLGEKQGFSAAREHFKHTSWEQSSQNKNPFMHTIPTQMLFTMNDKPAFVNNIYCFHKSFGDLYIQECENAIKSSSYKFGFDLAMINYTFYKHNPNGVIFHNRWHNDIDKEHLGINLDQDKNIKLNEAPHPYLGFISLNYYLKSAPYRLILSNGLPLTQGEIKKANSLNEENAHYECMQNNKVQGNLFYRIYSTPEDLYGPIEEILK